MDSDFKRGMWLGLFSPTPILPMSWWWEYFDNRGTDAYFARIKTISNQMLAAGKGGFEQIELHSGMLGITVMGVKCGNKQFYYFFNENLTTQTLDLEVPALSSKYQGLSYDCETGKVTKANVIKLANGKFKISGELPAKADVVITIDK